MAHEVEGLVIRVSWSNICSFIMDISHILVAHVVEGLVIRIS